MIFHPTILALLISSALISLMISYSAYFGIQILRHWNLQDGSEVQLILERRTYLLSTLLAYLFAFELVSLFFFIYTVDRLHSLFVGAMCAAGSLNVNPYGYPALVLKIINSLLVGLWLIFNDTDNRAYDYPLIRKKYLLLLVLTPLLLGETLLQANYFFNLKPDIMTSCCGSLFNPDTGGISSEMAGLPALPAKIVFFSLTILTIFSGVFFYRRDRGGYLFAGLGGLTFPVSILSIISFISLYFYELPTHHCPFCLLQREYFYIGYPLYVALLGGTVTAMGVGLLMPFRSHPSLKDFLPPFQKRLALISSILYVIFAVMVTLRMVFSDFILEGY